MKQVTEIENIHQLDMRSSLLLGGLGFGQLGPDVLPVSWPQVFAGNGAFGNLLDAHAVNHWDMALVELPLPNSGLCHSQSAG